VRRRTDTSRTLSLGCLLQASPRLSLAMNATRPLSNRLLRWPWPLPALAVWCLAWLTWALLVSLGAPPLGAWLAGAAAGALGMRTCQGAWRRGLVLAGFPLSAWALGAAAALPAWGWLVLLLPLAVVYPLRAWRDAPFFPTPIQALQGLDEWVPPPARVLDAGCGLGHGLQALRRLWPQARLRGVEWSPLLALAARARCRWAMVARGDLWADRWGDEDLVYVFQRPESMPRVWSKAQQEMRPGSWLVSLEFAVPGVPPTASLQHPGKRPVWAYRLSGDANGAIPGSIRSPAGR
jgi:hypothetical protein